MSLLAVGLSHRTAPVELLERASISGDELPVVLSDLVASENVAGAIVLSTCNRIEIYADVERFHGGVKDVIELLAGRAGLDVAELSAHLYVHYEDAAVAHVFNVAAGLDSMVVGEAQVLGQLRAAYSAATEQRAVGRVLHELAQQALRVGKRAHAEAGIDDAGRNLVAVALDEADRLLGGRLSGARALVVGAGAMGALAATTLRRRDVGRLTVANRTPANAARLADTLAARVVGLDAIGVELATADIVFASTGATGRVLEAATVAAARADGTPGPLVVVDLGLPRDVDPAVADLPGVDYVDLAFLREHLGEDTMAAQLAPARRIVADEVSAFLSWQRTVQVAPTVAALRAQAADVVAAELARLQSRVPGLDPATHSEVTQMVNRVVDKLLHAPSVRVKQLAGEPGGETYAEALRELFGLSVAGADVGPGRPREPLESRGHVAGDMDDLVDKLDELGRIDDLAVAVTTPSRPRPPAGPTDRAGASEPADRSEGERA